MAKAPAAGRSKTRLTPPLSPDQAAALSAAFLRDVTENVRYAARQAPIDGYIAYAPAGTESLFEGHLAEGTGLILADGTPAMPDSVQGLGRCLVHAVETLLAAGYRGACLLNADSPNLPTSFLVQAANTLLLSGERVVLGPAEDGGYYLIGMTAPHALLFADIAWSSSGVAAATRERAHALDLPVTELPMWYDVDDVTSLQRLLTEMDAGAGIGAAAYPAPSTAACLAGFGLRSKLPATAQ